MANRISLTEQQNAGLAALNNPNFDPIPKQDIAASNSLATESSQQAAENIKGSKEFNITPEQFKIDRNNLLATMMAETKKRAAHPVIAKHMRKSDDHAAVIGEDLDIFDGFTDYFDLMAAKYKGSDINSRLSHLGWKKASGDELTDDEEWEIRDLNKKMRKVSKSIKKLGFSELEQSPIDLGLVFVDMGRAVGQGTDILGTAAGVSSLYAGTAGLLAGVILKTGPLKTAATAIRIGATRTTVLSLPIVFGRYAYRQAFGQIYNELSLNLKEANPKFQEMAEQERRDIARGAARIIGGLSVVPVLAISRKVPWVERLLSPRKAIAHAGTPAGVTWLHVFKTMGKAGALEGGEESAQEFTEILATALGPTWNGSETDMQEAIINASEKWETHLARLAKAGALGAAGGAVTTGVAFAADPVINKIVGHKPKKPEDGGAVDAKPSPLVKENPDLPLVIKGLRAQHLKTLLENTYQITKDTKTNEVMPEEMDSIRQDMFEEMGVPLIYLNKDDLNAWADNDEKVNDIKEVLGIEGIIDGEINAPIVIKSNKFLRLMDRHQDVAGLVKPTPESLTANEFVGRLEEAQRKIEEFKSELPSPKDVNLEAGEAGVQTDELEARIRDENIFTEDDYFEQPTFTEDQLDVLPKATIRQINKAQLEVRQKVVEAIDADKNKEMEKIIDVNVETRLLFERELKSDEIQNDRSIEMVDSFLENNNISGDLNEFQKGRLAQDLPINAIDPRTLSKKDLARFKSDEVLKKRKVFNEKGLHVKDAVMLFGAKDARALLKTLSETPTREQALEIHVEEQRAEIERQARTNVYYDESKINDAYNNATKNHINEIRHLLKSNWPALKKMFKVVVFKLPRLSALRAKARTKILSSKINQLNPNQWEMGERISQRKATNSVLRNEVEIALREKENAAYNAQLSKETRIAIGKTNNDIRWLMKFGDKSIQNVLTEAGDDYVQAAGHIIELFGTGEKQNKIDRYAGWVKKRVAAGEGDFEIPDAVATWLEPTSSIGELTVEQFSTMMNILKNIYHQARKKNKMMRKYTEFHEDQAKDIIAENIHQKLVQHKSYDPKKAQELPSVAGIGARKKVAKLFRVSSASLKNIKFTTLNLDEEVEGALMFNLIFRPLDLANIDVTNFKKAVREKIDPIKKKYKGFNALGRERIKIKEFEHSPGLHNGKLLKVDLLTLLLNMGNDGNQEAISNFGVPIETMMDVLRRELPVEAFDYVQGVWDSFVPLGEELQTVHRETKSEELNMVSFLGFEAHGKEFTGGYYPVKLSFGTSGNNVVSIVGGLDTFNKESKSQPYAAYEGFVRSPHTKSRKGSKWVVDLNSTILESIHDDIINDIAFRVPVRDVSLLLNDPSIAFDIKSIVGTEAYNALSSNVARLTQNLSSQDLIVHKEINKFIVGALRHVENAAIVNWLALSPSTFMINNLAIKEIGGKMGPTSVKYLPMASTRLGALIMTGKSKEILDWVASIDPSVRGFREGISDFTPGTLAGQIPKVRVFKNAGYHKIQEGFDLVTHLGLEVILGNQDYFFKSVAVIASYQQYLNGDAPGHSRSKIMAFTEEERNVRAEAYAHSVVSSTTMRAKSGDKAAAQHHQAFTFFTKLMNELRSMLGNRASTARGIAANTKEMQKQIENGNFIEANIAFSDATGGMTTILVLSMITTAVTNISLGNEPFPVVNEEGKKITRRFDFSAEQLGKLPQWMFEYVTTVGGFGDLLTDSALIAVPFIRESVWGTETGRAPSVPLLIGGKSLVSGVTITSSYLRDLVDGASFADAWSKISKKDRKELLSAVGTLRGGLPVSALYKWEKLLGDPGTQDDDLPSGVDTPNFLESAVGFLGGLAAELMKDSEPERRALGEELQKAVDQIKQPKFLVTADQFEVIAYTESDNAWFRKNARSGARGIYQFIPDTWSRIVNSKEGREAGLTIDGLTDRAKVGMQHKAMHIFTRWNIEKLRNSSIKVTTESIYYMHHFENIKDARRIFLGKDSFSMTGTATLSRANVRGNPWLRGIKTAGGIRRGLQRLLKKGAEKRDEDN